MFLQTGNVLDRETRQVTDGSILEVFELLLKTGRGFKMGLCCGFWNGPWENQWVA